MNAARAHGEIHGTVLAVHARADGYWYIGAGRSIAEGPYRDADQLLTVASDLNPVGRQQQWSALAHS